MDEKGIFEYSDFQKMKWLRSHGYEQTSGSCFKLDIIVPGYRQDGGMVPRYSFFISMDQVSFMTMEELEGMDQNAWFNARQAVLQSVTIQPDGSRMKPGNGERIVWVPHESQWHIHGAHDDIRR